MKKSLVALLLAGTMTFSLVGTGCGKEKEQKKGLKDVVHDLCGVLEDVKASMNGEYEFGAKGEMKLTFGDGVTALLGTEVKPITITFDESQKNQKSCADLSFKYDSKEFLTATGTSDYSDNNMYINIPDFGDPYLKFNFMDLFGVDSLVNLTDEDEDTEVKNDALKTFENIDFNKLADDIDGYIDLIKEKTPDPKKVEKVSGEIDKNKYEFDAKTYEITKDDFKVIEDAVTDKAKKDSLLKDIAASMGVSEEEFIESFDEDKTDESENDSSEKDEPFAFTAFYDDDMLTGLSIKDDFDLRVINSEDVCAIDGKFKAADNVEITIGGSSVKKDDKINGNYDIKMVIKDEEIASQAFKVSCKLTDVVSTEEVFSGTVEFGIDIDTGYGITISPVITLKSNTTKDKLDKSIDIKVGDVNYATLTLNAESTNEIKDVALPTGKIYDFADPDQLQEYYEKADAEAFLKKMTDVFGEDLINTLKSLFAAETYDEDYIDWDYDEGEYDEGDYDFEIGDFDNLDVLEMSA